MVIRRLRGGTCSHGSRARSFGAGMPGELTVCISGDVVRFDEPAARVPGAAWLCRFLRCSCQGLEVAPAVADPDRRPEVERRGGGMVGIGRVSRRVWPRAGPRKADMWYLGSRSPAVDISMSGSVSGVDAMLRNDRSRRRAGLPGLRANWASKRSPGLRDSRRSPCVRRVRRRACRPCQSAGFRRRATRERNRWGCRWGCCVGPGHRRASRRHRQQRVRRRGLTVELIGARLMQCRLPR
jgi:hypothetical protein